MKYFKYVLLLLISMYYSCSSQSDCENADQEIIFFVNVKLINSDGTNFLNTQDINSDNFKIVSNDNSLINEINYEIIANGEAKFLRFSMANTNTISFKFNTNTLETLQVEDLKSEVSENCTLNVYSYDVVIRSSVICDDCNKDDVIEVNI